jgi:peptidoglycan hydrolase-like protein with peptidoglycan-binding domain
VVDRAARVVEVPIPAETRTIRVRKEVAPASEQRIVVPATTRTIQRRVERRPAAVEWREVLCETNASSAQIASVQRALTAAGYTVPATGTFGPQTLAAMERFQRDRGLAVGYLTMETVRALGAGAR